MKHSVLDILRTEARLTNAEIARRIGGTEDEVGSAVRELEESGTVIGYRAVVDPEKLDDETCLGIIEVRLHPQRNQGYDAIAANIYRFPEVKTCLLVSGAYDLLVFVEGDSLKSVARFVTEKLSTLDNVVSTTTHFILKKYKEAGVIMGGEDKVERLAVTP